MDTLINVALPISLAVIMFSLGVGLRRTDFTRILRQPRTFGLGAVSQVIMLPIVAFAITQIFALSPEMSVGIMLLSFCPGGVTSNMLTRLARGDVALSVSLTATISLLSIFTVPALSAFSVIWFMGAAAPQVSVTGLALAMFVITTLPVLAGIVLRDRAPVLARRIEPALARIATVLFAAIVLAALAGNWSLFVANLALLGPALLTLNISLLGLGFAVAWFGGLAWHQIKTISIEAGVQNSTLGITLAAFITGTDTGFSPLALPAAVYGITMYFVAGPLIVWFRHR